jgi:hypothetical protein
MLASKPRRKSWMNDIVAKRFESKLGIDEMLEVLQKHAADLASWRGRESEYEGNYIRGYNFSGAKIRIIWYNSYYEVEIWFDSDHNRRTAAAERPAIVEMVDRLLLDKIRVTNLAPA